MSKLKVNELDTKTGTTITVAAGKTLAGTDIIGSTQIAANAVDTSEIAANAVTLVELEDGTQGDILYYGASGVPTRLAAGTSGQFMKTLGSGQNPGWGTITEYNDTAIMNDIATLALHSATQNNQTAYNLTNAFVDQYEDSTGLDVLTDCARTAGEYMASIIPENQVTTLVNNISRSSATYKFGGYSALFDGTEDYLRITADTTMNITGGDFTIEAFVKPTSSAISRLGIFGRRNAGQSSAAAGGYAIALYNGKFGLLGNINNTWYDQTGPDFTGTTDIRNGAWHHVASVREGNVYSQYVDGTRENTQTLAGTLSEPAVDSAIGGTSNGSGGLEGDWYTNIDEFRLSNVARYSGASLTVPTAAFTTDTNTKLLLHMDDALLTDSSQSAPGVVNAAGNYTSTTETALSTVSKMSIVVLYKNSAGTATLDTDLVAQVSANGGTNYTAAPLTPGGTFSTGILIAKSNDITITQTGTAPKYKISFANQANGSKVTQVYGVALMY